jgi:hypothetical protein
VIKIPFGVAINTIYIVQQWETEKTYVTINLSTLPASSLYIFLANRLSLVLVK